MDFRNTVLINIMNRVIFVQNITGSVYEIYVETGEIDKIGDVGERVQFTAEVYKHSVALIGGC